jgi:uncharacterized membrane protein
LFLCFASCGKQADTTAEPASPLLPPAATTAGQAPAASTETPTDSSLAIKRGLVTIAADHTTVRLCGDSKELWFTDLSDGRFAEMYSRPDGDASLTMYVEAYGERGAVPAGNAAANRYPGAFLSEQVLYLKANPDAKVCDAPPPAYKVLAVGSEAPWSLEVTGDQGRWHHTGKPADIGFAGVAAEDSEGTVRYRAKSEGHNLELLVAEQLCRNTGSGETFAYSAQASIDNQTFAGCARLGE